MRTTKTEFFILIIMSLIGLASSITVLYEVGVLGKMPPLCTIHGNPVFLGSVVNCAAVLYSSYSTFYGISLEALAAVWFIINLVLITLVIFSDRGISKKIFYVLFGWRFLGIAIVPYLVYLEFFVLHAICIYCTIMHIAIIIDFGIITYLVFSEKSKIKRDLFGS